MSIVLAFPTVRPVRDDNFPACDEGWTLAQGFIDSCMKALESESSSNFNARFENYQRHKRECQKCNEL
jgi:hypothetical protein